MVQVECPLTDIAVDTLPFPGTLQRHPGRLSRISDQKTLARQQNLWKLIFSLSPGTPRKGGM